MSHFCILFESSKVLLNANWIQHFWYFGGMTPSVQVINLLCQLKCILLHLLCDNELAPFLSLSIAVSAILIFVSRGRWGKEIFFLLLVCCTTLIFFLFLCVCVQIKFYWNTVTFIHWCDVYDCSHATMSEPSICDQYLMATKTKAIFLLMFK